MLHIKKFNELNEWSPNDIISELCIELEDSGLKVTLSEIKKEELLNIKISDESNIFCKNYPEDDMDWLYSKKIITDFLDKLTDFGLIRDKDYKVYGGGLSVTLVFDSNGLKSIKL